MGFNSEARSPGTFLTPRRCMASASLLCTSAKTKRCLRRLAESAANTPGVSFLSVIRKTCHGWGQCRGHGRRFKMHAQQWYRSIIRSDSCGCLPQRKLTQQWEDVRLMDLGMLMLCTAMVSKRVSWQAVPKQMLGHPRRGEVRANLGA